MSLLRLTSGTPYGDETPDCFYWAEYSEWPPQMKGNRDTEDIDLTERSH